MSTHDEQNISNLIKHYTAQAQWHLQQYQNYSYYVRYYTRYYNSMKENPHPTCSVQGNITDSSCGYYFPKSEQGKKKKNKKRNRGRTHQTELDRGLGTRNNVELAEQIETDGSEFELDKGFKEFLRQSAEFRKERDAAKLKKKSSNQEADVEMPHTECVEYVDILRKGPDGTILPPTASNRKELYEDKYGEAGTKILSLETALQWKFNSFIDTTSPKPWPALQIRFG